MKIPTDAHFGAMVQASRELKGWSMTEFASRLREVGLTNFHPTTVSRLERGERPVRLGEAAVIANVLDTQLGDLVVEPLPANSELELDGESLEMVSKWAAWWSMRAESDKDHIVRLVSDLEDQVRDGEVPEDELEETLASIKKWKEVVAQDRVKFWLQHIQGLSDDDRQEFRKKNVR